MQNNDEMIIQKKDGYIVAVNTRTALKLIINDENLIDKSDDEIKKAINERLSFRVNCRS